MKLLEYFKNNRNLIWIYPVLSGIFLVLSSNYNIFWFFSFFSLVPLIHFAYKIKKNSHSLLGFLLFGLIFFGGVMIWAWHINIYTWIGVSNFWLIHGIIFCYWFFFVFLSGFFNFSILGWFFFRFKTRTYWDVLLFPSLWVLGEYFRSLIFALVSLSPDSLFGAHNTFGFVGYALASSINLLQLARLGGVYLLSFVVALVNILIYKWFVVDKKINNKTSWALLILFIFYIFIPLNNWFKRETTEDKGTKISALQTKNKSFFSTNRKKEKEKRKIYEKLLFEINKNNFDSEIIIFPEDSRFTQGLMNDRLFGNYYKNVFNDPQKIIIDSSRITDSQNETKLRLYYYNIENAHFDKYDKVLLTPGGEYLPSSFLFLAEKIGFKDWANSLNSGKYSTGSDLELGEFKNKKIGGVFCFEIVSPEISRKMTQKGAQLFVNPASHSSFEGYPVLYNQIINMTKVRAVENNRYFIQAGNYIPSSIITNEGKIISTDFIGEDVLTGNVFFIREKTFFTKFGNWFVYLIFIISFYFCFSKNNKTNKLFDNFFKK